MVGVFFILSKKRVLQKQIDFFLVIKFSNLNFLLIPTIEFFLLVQGTLLENLRLIDQK